MKKTPCIFVKTLIQYITKLDIFSSLSGKCHPNIGGFRTYIDVVETLNFLTFIMLARCAKKACLICL